MLRPKKKQPPGDVAAQHGPGIGPLGEDQQEIVFRPVVFFRDSKREPAVAGQITCLKWPMPLPLCCKTALEKIVSSRARFRSGRPKKLI